MWCLRRMQYSMMMAAIVVVIIGSTSVSEGQDLGGCAANLVPCVDFMNFTIRPPSSCCDPLSQAVAQQLSCLCNLFAFPSFFESLSINFTLDIRLPSLCGISTDLTTCQGGNNRTPILPSSSAPPKNNRDDDDNNDSTENNDADTSENNSKKKELTRLLLSLLLFCTCLIISA